MKARDKYAAEGLSARNQRLSHNKALLAATQRNAREAETLARVTARLKIATTKPQPLGDWGYDALLHKALRYGVKADRFATGPRLREMIRQAILNKNLFTASNFTATVTP